MKLIPDRCPRCLAAPRYEGAAYTLYLCGSVIAQEEDGKDKVGSGCVARPEDEVRLLEHA